MGAPEWDSLRELDDDGGAASIGGHLWAEGRMDDDLVERPSARSPRSSSSPLASGAASLLVLAALALLVGLALRRPPSPEVPPADKEPLAPSLVESDSVGGPAPPPPVSPEDVPLPPSPSPSDSPASDQPEEPPAEEPVEEELSEADPFGLLALADGEILSGEEKAQGDPAESPVGGEEEAETPSAEGPAPTAGPSSEVFEGEQEVDSLLRETQDALGLLEAQTEITMRTNAIREMAAQLQEKMKDRAPLSKTDGEKALTGAFALRMAAVLAEHAHRPYVDDALRILNSLAFGKVTSDELLRLRYSEAEGVEWVDDLEELVSKLPSEAEALASLRADLEQKEKQRDDADLEQRRTENSELLESLQTAFYTDPSVTSSLEYLQNDLQIKLDGLQKAIDEVHAAAQRLTSLFSARVHPNVLMFIKQLEITAETQLQAEAGRLNVLLDLARGKLLVPQSQRKAERQLTVRAFAAFDAMSTGPVNEVLPTHALEILEPANPLSVEDDFEVQVERLRRWAATFSHVYRQQGVEIGAITEQVTRLSGMLLSRPFDENLAVLTPADRDAVLSVNEAIVGKGKMNPKDLSRALSQLRDPGIVTYSAVADWFELEKEEPAQIAKGPEASKQPVIRKHERVKKKKKGGPSSS